MRKKKKKIPSLPPGFVIKTDTSSNTLYSSLWESIKTDKFRNNQNIKKYLASPHCKLGTIADAGYAEKTKPPLNPYLMDLALQSKRQKGVAVAWLDQNEPDRKRKERKSER